jgi:hypothetical protein
MIPLKLGKQFIYALTTNKGHNMHWNGLLYIVVWDEVKTCNLGPTPTSLVFCLKNNGLVSQDDMEKLDWLFNKNICKIIFHKFTILMIQKNVTICYYAYMYIKYLEINDQSTFLKMVKQKKINGYTTF